MSDCERLTIVWLRRDLRLADNPALVAAYRQGAPVVPVALWPREHGMTRATEAARAEPSAGLASARAGLPGAAARWWLARSLVALDADLRRRGSALVVRAADPGAAGAPALAALAADMGARLVVWARGVDPAQRTEDEAARRALAERGVEALVVPSAALLADPDTVRTAQGDPYKVFTPFWRAVSGGLRPPAPLPAAEPPLPAPEAPAPPSALLAGLPLADLERDAVRPGSADFGDTWQPGEAGARARLARLLDDVMPAYADDRDRPDREGSSRLSPHLHWGEVSPRQVWHAVAGRLAESGIEAEAAIGPPPSKQRAHPAGADAGTPEAGAPQAAPSAALPAGLARGGAAFLRQLGWREFAHHLLWHFPDTVTQPLREQFAAFPWRDDPDGLAAWRRGVTGYPFVDAAMRSLWTTGWMHNRARLVAGSFLVKDLLLPWQAGAAWFWDTLIDADLANNTLGWQWVSGCGSDAAPYFRIFNPVTQGRRFDPGGTYVRRWVPELAGLPAEWIHEPWAAPGDVLAAAGVRLGETYPERIVDHGEARSRALAAYEIVKLSG